MFVLVERGSELGPEKTVDGEWNGVNTVLENRCGK